MPSSFSAHSVQRPCGPGSILVWATLLATSGARGDGPEDRRNFSPRYRGNGRRCVMSCSPRGIRKARAAVPRAEVAKIRTLGRLLAAPDRCPASSALDRRPKP
jgi:hypothetical protein